MHLININVEKGNIWGVSLPFTMFSKVDEYYNGLNNKIKVKSINMNTFISI